jgi:hypothetical protein
VDQGEFHIVICKLLLVNNLQIKRQADIWSRLGLLAGLAVKGCWRRQGGIITRPAAGAGGHFSGVSDSKSSGGSGFAGEYANNWRMIRRMIQTAGSKIPTKARLPSSKVSTRSELSVEGTRDGRAGTVAPELSG